MKFIRVDVLPHELPNACAPVINQHGRFITMVASDECERGIDRFVVRYLFAHDGKSELTMIESVLPGSDPTYASVSSIIPAASWAEREAYDLFGIRPIGHPDLRPLVLHEHWPEGVYPLRKDYPLTEMPARDTARSWSYPKVEGEGVFEVPVGPIHAGVIEPGHFRFQVMGDSVLHLEAKLFYTHRGIEKRSEGMKVTKGLYLAERICGVCSVSHALSYAQAIESIAGTKIPKRAEFLRVLFAEMERLYNHVGDIGNMCAGIGYAYGINHGARLKEQLMQMNDCIIGHRFLRGCIALGGVAEDITEEKFEHIRRTLEQVERELHEIVEQILSHDIVINRFANTGVLPEQVVRELSAVGPTARASNYDVDARRDLPYAAYSELFFDVPTLAEGDVLARFKQRFLEAEQSFRLVEQVIQSIPKGDIRVPIGEFPPNAYGIGITESPRGENVHFVMTGPNHTIYRYRVRSAPYANWPAVPFCVPGNIIPDFPLINKSFELCYACCDR
ncbi:hydrogenase large subunit [Alicyclobacillus fastidiosus]|uniref:NADH-quinone oxidoreductase subunit C n=1 Tax=Alicyclobacillus fastidiosus TaxID=392011 RepID=A0ABV5AIN0_9BACL|nr:NADH-quinone oxidoreductase subunit C [Alicyclobacillus fastidiosus]WEH10081.1 NADH-quinone oxidoreductase subunit C [Alicyclobacillus fastidiosus]